MRIPICCINRDGARKQSEEGGGQLNMCLETIHYFEGINVTFLEIIHQFTMYRILLSNICSLFCVALLSAQETIQSIE